MSLGEELLKIAGENAESVGVKQWLDTGIPELNLALSNDYARGFPVGRLVEIFGPAQSGKTFISTMIMSSAQKTGGVVGFSDHERTFDINVANTLGLKTGGLSDGWIYKRPQTFEDSIEIAISTAEKIRKAEVIDPEAPIVWVFDSVASMIPHAKLFDDSGNRRAPGSYNMRDKLLLAQSTSQSYPLLAQFAEDNGMLVLLLNQIRQKPGVMFGDPTTTPGGGAAEFYASIRLSLARKDITNGKKGVDKVVEGFEVTSQTVKNKCARFGRKASWKVGFNEGLGVTIDQIGTNIDYLIRIGKIDKSGAWLTFEGKKYQRTALIEELKSDPNGNEKLLSLL